MNKKKAGLKKEIKKSRTILVVLYVILVAIFTIALSMLILKGSVENINSAAVTGFVVQNIDKVDVENGYFFPIAALFGVVSVILGVLCLAGKNRIKF